MQATWRRVCLPPACSRPPTIQTYASRFRAGNSAGWRNWKSLGARGLRQGPNTTYHYVFTDARRASSTRAGAMTDGAASPQAQRALLPHHPRGRAAHLIRPAVSGGADQGISGAHRGNRRQGAVLRDRAGGGGPGPGARRGGRGLAGAVPRPSARHSPSP